MKIFKRIREAAEYRDLFSLLVRHQLEQRYQGSLLGFLWTLLNPLLVFVTFSVVFAFLNRLAFRDYGIYFFSGFVVWGFFSGACAACAESIVGNPALVNRVYVPKVLLPAASVAVNFVDFGARLVTLFIIMLATGAHFSWSLVLLPLPALFLALFVLGISMGCACLNVYFRDFRHLLGTLLMVGFFFSPVLWKISDMPSEHRWWFRINPIVPFLDAFQTTIWMGTWPNWQVLAIAGGLGIVSAVLGLFAFFRCEDDFYFYL